MRKPDPNAPEGHFRLPLPDDPDITLPLEETLHVDPQPVARVTASVEPKPAARRSAYGFAVPFFAACLVLVIAAGYGDTNAPRPPVTIAPPPLASSVAVPVLETLEWELPTPQLDETLAEALAQASRARQPAPREASAIRRECMAQIESASLFRGIARSSTDAEDYARAVETESDRLLSAGKVDQRTLAQIADQAWTNRAKAELAATWWTRQYQRCEARRTAGATYVVRSD